MNNSSNDDDNNTDADTVSAGKKGGASEAGVFRGIARSIGRSSGTSTQKGISMMRMPTIGRLPTAAVPSPTISATAASKVIFRQGSIPKVSPPKITVAARPSNFIPKKVPIKQVVKVSDHVSQGISFIDSASEASTNSSKMKRNAFEERIMQLRTFASSLVKNTILGIVVFEIYGAIVDSFIPAHIVSKRVDDTSQTSAVTTASRIVPLEPLPNDNNLLAHVSIHSWGGFMGGAAHGVVATLWDSISIQNQNKIPKHAPCQLGLTHGRLNPALVMSRYQLPGMITHHGLSHAVLFGSYELSKRLIFSRTLRTKHTYHDVGHDSSEQNQEHTVQVEYLTYIFLAGGLAGQAQHIASHFTEKLFLKYTNSACFSWKTLLPLAMSFFPSGIAFVAFEYGQNG